MRGKPGDLGAVGVPVRIIPARAGQTTPIPCHRTGGSDHPRACGANLSAYRSAFSFRGSSPRVRGKPLRKMVQGLDTRIIPARAGQTGDTASQRQSSTDHPRACGANVGQEFGEQQQAGSSPRVRGKLVGRAHSVVIRRIIPARAGQTGGGAGGNLNARYGSSPRVRGKPHAAPGAYGHLRIIPARAGQTSSFSVSSIITSDHPRACGANLFFSPFQRVQYGSSPRVRGKPLGPLLTDKKPRIIPARAGQTSRSCTGGE